MSTRSGVSEVSSWHSQTLDDSVTKARSKCDIQAIPAGGMRVMDLPLRVLRPAGAAMLRSFAPTSLLSIAMVSLQSNRRAYVRVGSHRLWIYSSSRC